MTAVGDAPLVEYWVAGRPIPGEAESGDAYLVAPFPGGALAAVVDGLGHGPRAHDAAVLAIDTLAQQPGDPLPVLMQRCHHALKTSRGAVMTLASFNAAHCTMSWLAVGNVDAFLLRAAAPGAKPAAIVPRGGIVGDRLPPLNPVTLPVYPGDLLLLATDGIATAFIREIGALLQPRQLVNHILTQHAKSTDDALIVGVQWINGNKAPAAVP
ncbi:MAG TPA: SpoIIE family protein phosphatase [Noviherbaspirillum sp.]|uniref:SpoIIE family protein phosphatase n=1 Tax=Noviherbaspirillum sp. TaxID=1926288 RepID=UPI002D38B1D0|nr:SpoIIE family protein phosphatase [Noviherbaspirillum sp.]HYD94154.1 SpoIIE family protein phosphatase [Noviherbaspirillum sp.]